MSINAKTAVRWAIGLPVSAFGFWRMHQVIDPPDDVSDLAAQAVDVEGMKVLAARLDGADPKALRDTVDQLKNKLGSAAVVLAAVVEGKVSLVVNVASKCGYTPQYEGLEKLHKELQSKSFSVLGFPSNDFGGQEPGTAEEIVNFCKATYGVTFPMFEKVVTKAGPGQSPVYAYLGTSGSLPAWNFGKYVIGKDGHVVAYFPSKVTPDAPELRAAIDKALAAN